MTESNYSHYYQGHHPHPQEQGNFDWSYWNWYNSLTHAQLTPSSSSTVQQEVRSLSVPDVSVAFLPPQTFPRPHHHNNGNYQGMADWQSGHFNPWDQFGQPMNPTGSCSSAAIPAVGQPLLTNVPKMWNLPPLGPVISSISPAAPDSSTAPSSSSQELVLPVKVEEPKKALPKIMIGKRRGGGRLLPTGVVKKQKAEKPHKDNKEIDNAALSI